jgi:OOP family OmpA-OmpF porin
MMKNIRVLIGVMIIGLVSACAGTAIDDAASMKPKGQFNTYLHQGYIKLARWEADQGDWKSGQHFASKASAAASGGVAPDNPAMRDISKKNLRVWKEYDRLTKALASGAPNSTPKACADAQVAFDSWIEQKEECVQPKHIKKAWQDYKKAIEKCMPMAAAPRTFIVFFDFDSSKLTPEANRILDTAAGYIKKGQGAKVVLTGHTDTSGSAKYNEGLSLRRANAVWSGLVDRGIAAKRMKVYAKGESDPLISTGDGVKEPQNRRVTIDVK